MCFMKQDKKDRLMQRDQDLKDRVKQREEDINLIKDMIVKVVNAKVSEAIEPVKKRQEILDEKCSSLMKKVEELSEEIGELRLRSNDKERGRIIAKDEEQTEEGMEEYNKVSSEFTEVVSAARKTVGLHCIYPEAVQKELSSGAENEDIAMLKVAKEFLQEEMHIGEEVLAELEIET